MGRYRIRKGLHSKMGMRPPRTKEGPSHCHGNPSRALRSLAFHLNGYGLHEFEAERSLGGDDDIFLSGCSGGSRAGTRAYCSADQGALAASGNAADQRARAGATADELEVALVMVAAGTADRAGCELVSLPTHFH